MIETAISAVKQAGKISQKNFKKQQKVFYKGKEVVTKTDLEVDDLIRSVIKRDFPAHSILSEEGEYCDKDSKYLWIIDPIDGTRNYSQGKGPYGISVALAKEKEVILGVVYNPLTDELFYSEKGHGAFLNKKPIHVSEVSNLSKALFYSSKPAELGKYQKILDYLNNVRIKSSSAYETCLVACGKAEGMIRITDHPWGFAAASLIVEEAGGRVSNFDGTKWNIDSTKIITSNNRLYSRLLRLIDEKL